THLAFLRVVLGNLTGQVIPRHRAIHLVQELLTACPLALTGKFRFRKTQLAHDEQTREGVTDEVYRWAGELFRPSLDKLASSAHPRGDVAGNFFLCRPKPL